METPKYWQEEPGKIIDTGKNVLEYYPRAMKLRNRLGQTRWAR